MCGCFSTEVLEPCLEWNVLLWFLKHGTEIQAFILWHQILDCERQLWWPRISLCWNLQSRDVQSRVLWTLQVSSFPLAAVCTSTSHTGARPSCGCIYCCIVTFVFPQYGCLGDITPISRTCVHETCTDSYKASAVLPGIIIDCDEEMQVGVSASSVTFSDSLSCCMKTHMMNQSVTRSMWESSFCTATEYICITVSCGKTEIQAFICQLQILHCECPSAIVRFGGREFLLAEISKVVIFSDSWCEHY